MLRLRLASLALASGLLFTASGCWYGDGSEDGRLFPRLFPIHPAGSYVNGDCECRGAHSLPPVMDSGSMPGPVWPSPPPPKTASIPITTAPVNQPNIFPIPQALPTPYTPAP